MFGVEEALVDVSHKTETSSQEWGVAHIVVEGLVVKASLQPKSCKAR